MKEKLAEKTKPKEIIGQAYEGPKRLTKQTAKNDYPVLFIGETGTGKQLFAEHYFYWNDKRPYWAEVNCAEFEETILRSEVFGHKKGSFTGAVTNRKGLLEEYGGGILFLDEFGEASPGFQAAILKVVEGGVYRPIGSNKPQRNGCMIIAATNSPEKVRKDLKRRFHEIPIPPLQPFDIPQIANIYCKKKFSKTFKASVLDELTNMQFAGNVRELEKHLEILQIQRGKEIFANRGGNDYRTNSVSFDYYRFCSELVTWQECIQPIINRYKLNRKYKYMLKTTEAKETYEGVFSNHMTPDQIKPFLKELSRAILAPFIEVEYGLPALFFSIFNSEVLPFLLEDLYLIRHEQPISTREPTDVSHLFDMKYKEAQDAFFCLYLHHHIRKHSSHTDAAEAIGMRSTSTLDSALQRLRRKGYSI